MSHNPHQTRRYFESSLSEAANDHGVDPKAFREGFKYALQLCGVIRNSTTEIREDTLRKLADRIRQDTLPPPPDNPYPSCN